MPQDNLTGADLEAGRWNMDEMLMNELVQRPSGPSATRVKSSM